MEGSIATPLTDHAPNSRVFRKTGSIHIVVKRIFYHYKHFYCFILICVRDEVQSCSTYHMLGKHSTTEIHSSIREAIKVSRNLEKLVEMEFSM